MTIHLKRHRHTDEKQDVLIQIFIMIMKCQKTPCLCSEQILTRRKNCQILLSCHSESSEQSLYVRVKQSTPPNPLKVVGLVLGFGFSFPFLAQSSSGQISSFGSSTRTDASSAVTSSLASSVFSTRSASSAAVTIWPGQS